jgi:hypothetical protein
LYTIAILLKSIFRQDHHLVLTGRRVLLSKSVSESLPPKRSRGYGTFVTALDGAGRITGKGAFVENALYFR